MKPIEKSTFSHSLNMTDSRKYMELTIDVTMQLGLENTREYKLYTFF